MYLTVAVGMEQYAVVQLIAAAIAPPVDVMVMPASFSGDEFPTNRTASPLSNPKVFEPRTVPVIP